MFWKRKPKVPADVREATARFEEAADRLGNIHPETVRAAFGLARALTHHRDRDAATILTYQYVVAATTELVGADHPTTLGVQFELGLFHHRIGEVAEAEELIVTSLRGRERVLGHDHPDTIATARKLAEVRR